MSTLQDASSILIAFTSDSQSMEDPMDIAMMETDEMEEVLDLMIVDEPALLETASCLSQLVESLPSDAMNVVLSCFTCNEFQHDDTVQIIE